MKPRRSGSSDLNPGLAYSSVREPFADMEVMYALRWLNFGSVVMSLPNQSQKLLSNQAATTPNKARQFAPYGRRTRLQR
ncbi:MAG: hypothetical protein RLN85_12555, partial [Pseudomonadales bacterium]